MMQSKDGTSCGEDGVTPELLKFVRPDNIVLALINKAYEAYGTTDTRRLSPSHSNRTGSIASH